MKIIIAGGRDFDDYERLESVMFDFEYPEIEIVSGGARGADKLGETFASRNGIKLTLFPANWGRYGNSAGFLRNETMAKYGDILIAFWNGHSPGTKHMIDLALKHGLEVHVYRY